ncbi:MAG TPA: methylmalonyl Co-A mutase-associated GTPase MeaB, partial [Xanthobacteraceae bacterium]|nr:methylmalonyl Co-A mutase-associated GTPase MeaB [Xanthobacteraceae bacterium]
WQKILDHRARLSAAGEFAARRREQQVKWMWAMLEQRIARKLGDSALKKRLPALEAAVADGKLSPAVAAEELAAILGL